MFHSISSALAPNAVHQALKYFFLSRSPWQRRSRRRRRRSTVCSASQAALRTRTESNTSAIRHRYWRRCSSCTHSRRRRSTSYIIYTHMQQRSYGSLGHMLLVNLPAARPAAARPHFSTHERRHLQQGCSVADALGLQSCIDGHTHTNEPNTCQTTVVTTRQQSVQCSAIVQVVKSCS